MLRPLPLGYHGCVTSAPCSAGFQGQALSGSFLEKCPQTVLECLSVSSRRPAQGLRWGWEAGWKVTPGGAGRSQEKHLPSLPPICPDPHSLAWHRGAGGTTAKHGRQRKLRQLCQGAQLPRAQGEPPGREAAMPRGFKDKALLGRKGQGSGRDSADFLLAGRWWLVWRGGSPSARPPLPG